MDNTSFTSLDPHQGAPIVTAVLSLNFSASSNINSHDLINKLSMAYGLSLTYLLTHSFKVWIKDFAEAGFGRQLWLQVFEKRVVNQTTGFSKFLGSGGPFITDNGLQVHKLSFKVFNRLITKTFYKSY